MTKTQKTSPHPPPPNTLLPITKKNEPPPPPLQGIPGHISDPQQDMRDKIAADTKANESFGWADEKEGIAQIPVKEAMKIIAEKGLPNFPATPPEKKK